MGLITAELDRYRRGCAAVIKVSFEEDLRFICNLPQAVRFGPGHPERQSVRSVLPEDLYRISKPQPDADTNADADSYANSYANSDPYTRPGDAWRLEEILGKSLNAVQKGDLVIYGDGKAGRVTAFKDDYPQISKEIIFINGLQLPHGICEEKTVSLFPEFNDSILSETNNNKTYPVVSDISTGRIKKIKRIPLKEDEVLIVMDNRKQENFYMIISKKCLQYNKL